MHQKPKKEDGMQLEQGYWIYHKNKVELSSIYTNPEEKLWFVVNKYPKESYKTKGLKLQKNSIIRMGRIRLRVRDIDYPEPKVELDQKSQKSCSPRFSNKNKTNISSNRRNSESLVDVNDIELNGVINGAGGNPAPFADLGTIG